MLDALTSIAALTWRWLCVGSVEGDPEFAEVLRSRALARGLGRRVRFPGPRAGAELARSYGAADLLVLPSRGEAYGMVVTEALARGIPVVAADVGPDSWSRPATRRRSPPRSAPGFSMPRSGSGCAGPRASGGCRLRRGRPRQRPSRVS
jgi:hypothetical protein